MKLQPGFSKKNICFLFCSAQIETIFFLEHKKKKKGKELL